MSEPSVEAIVARCETYQYSLPRDEQRALIASWRARGEALRKIADGQPHTDTWETSIARAALKDKP